MVNSNISNQVPELSGVDSTADYQIFVCAEDTLEFTVFSSDPDSGQVTSISVVQPLNGAIVNIDSSSTHASATITLPSNLSMISGLPYQLILSVRDYACPTNASQQYIYEVFVTNCDSSLVWPGDANNDFVADVVDILPIGIAYGSSGISRGGGTTNWVGQSATNWNQRFASGLDYKFADCDGNGQIDTNDVDVIYLNLGQTHLKTNYLGQGQPGDPELYLETDVDSFETGMAYDVYVGYGSQTVAADSVYGLAVTILFDAALINPDLLEVSFDGFQLGAEHLDLITLVDDKLAQHGELSIGMSRIDGRNFTLSGRIMKISIAINDSISSAMEAAFSFGMAKAISFGEDELPYSVVNLTVPLISSKLQTSLNSEYLENDVIQIFPNPVNGVLNYDISGNTLPLNLRVTDVSGKVVFKDDITGNTGTFDLSMLPSGLYIAQFNSAVGSVYKKLIAR